MPFANSWLQEAAARIQAGAYRVLSLDIFDTTVWRTYPTPSDLFLTLGARASDRGWLYPSSPPETLAATRTDCELRARRRKAWTSEVTLDEIYDEFPQGFLRDAGPGDLKNLELELERRATFPHPEVVALIDFARQRGLQIAFVSDTYFPESHLRTILPVTGDYLIPSCTYGISKVEGLHRALLEISGVKAEKILHIGDNLEADVQAPARMGISTLWFPKFTPPWNGAVQEELPAVRSDRVAFFASGGDYGLTSLRSMALNSNGNLLDVHQAWGATVLGPAMAAFCEWILERCRAEQIPACLFLMREGRILRRMIHRIDPQFPAFECYISRYAAVMANILSGSEEELSTFLARPGPTPAGRLLGPLGIIPEEIPISEDCLIEPAEAAKLARVIHERRELRRKALAAAQQTRTGLMLHLNHILPELPARLGIVDLGYGGTIQRCLQRIFNHWGLPVQTHGLYFITNASIGKVHETGAAAEGYLADRGYPVAVAHTFSRSPEVFEQSLMAHCGSTVGYEQSGKPVLDDLHVSAEQLETVDKVQNAALDFLDIWADHRSKVGADSRALRPFVTSLVVRAITSPTEEEIEALGSWRHDENFGSTNTRTLAGCTLPSVYLEHLSAQQLVGLRSQEVYWLFALARRLGRPLGEAAKAIFLRRIPAEAFQSTLPPVEMTVFWDDGRLHELRSTLKLSQNGACWERFSLQMNGAAVRWVGFQATRSSGPVVFRGAIVQYKSMDGTVRSLRIDAEPPCHAEGCTPAESDSFAGSSRWSFPVAADVQPGSVLTVDLFLAAAPAAPGKLIIPGNRAALTPEPQSAGG